MTRSLDGPCLFLFFMRIILFTNYLILFFYVVSRSVVNSTDRNAFDLRFVSARLAREFALDFLRALRAVFLGFEFFFTVLVHRFGACFA